MNKIRTSTPFTRLTVSVAAGCSALLILIICTGGLVAPSRAASGVHPLFEIHTPAGGPFPSDIFTVTDASQNTGLRIDLPKPDCSIRRSDCEDLDLINTLDGFNLQPRFSIPFNGGLDLTTVNSQTVFLIKLGDTLSEIHPADSVVIGINQIVWDPLTNTLHVESDALLEQHTRYALIVTNGLRDPEGQPVETSEAFEQFRRDLNLGQSKDHDIKDYRKSLLDALQAARRIGIQESDIVVASVFTTQSVTAILEKIRDQIKANTPAPADFLLGPGATRTVFTLGDVTSIRWNQQLRADSPALTPVSVNLSWLRNIPGAIGRIAFGKFLSPNYETAQRIIPQVGTRHGTPLVQNMGELFFNLYLPAGPTPAGGWPVALYGHGSGSSKQGGPQGGASMAMAAALAEQGIATLAINAVGHGFGSQGTLTVNTASTSVTFPAGGRGVDLDGDNVIGNLEGVRAIGPQAIIDTRDGFRQSAIDLMQVVRVIETGLDVEGDAVPDLDPSRIYCVGQSFGGNYGSDFLAVEPNVRVAVLLVTGGSFPDVSRLGPLSRPRIGALLAARTPSLVNTPGVTHLEGVPITGIRFHENMPLRDGVPLTVRLADGSVQQIRSPLINIVPGAISIQELIERMEWVQASGNGLAYAPYFRKAPLEGLSPKSLLYQFDTGDQTSPNPAETAYLRAGDLSDRATYYRNDLARLEDPAVPADPHTFPTRIDSPNALVRAIARGSQLQIATFLASDGVVIIHPEPVRFFEVPITGSLPEGLNYIFP